MTINRRKFLYTSGMLASGAALASLGCKTSQSSGSKDAPFGIQLYTLRADLPKDPKGVIKALGGYGYKQVESFEGQQGMFWGMTNKEFKAYLDSLGMNIVSSHCNINKDFEKKAAEAGEIGMKYLSAHFSVRKNLWTILKGSLISSTNQARSVKRTDCALHTTIMDILFKHWMDNFHRMS